MGTYLSDGMYNTDYDFSEEEDDSEYCDSSSDKSGESANPQSTSEKVDAFFSFSGNSNPLRIHDFSRLGNPWGYQ
jgi:hypothetical protein